MTKHILPGIAEFYEIAGPQIAQCRAELAPEWSTMSDEEAVYELHDNLRFFGSTELGIKPEAFDHLVEQMRFESPAEKKEALIDVAAVFAVIVGNDLQADFIAGLPQF